MLTMELRFYTITIPFQIAMTFKFNQSQGQTINFLIERAASIWGVNAYDQV